ncbi:MAG TPA: UDP-N-acetylmuramoyl-L-alanine--D-glutamate ligase [Candidatus Saccharimonadia bacterium]|nr:UDP-N-acetylmuramoyl-L-alanine--D-glutamate ligase [Candidatus Saccharimonadia bacterium]
MKIALLGFDVEGRSSFEYFKSQGHELTVRDQNPQVEMPDGVESVLGENYLDDLDQFDLLVRTAGLQPQKILEKNPDVGDKITTHMNEFFKARPTKNIIGITGTKGKGTTSTLIAKILEADGKHVKLGGNIGVPPLDFLHELKEDSWVVLELSSFQLIDIEYSPHIAVCLMVVPEHLNWHPDINDYTLAKTQLFAHQSAEDCAIYFADNELSVLIATASHGKKVPYFAPPGAYVNGDSIVIDDQVVCRIAELKLFGEHNWQNVCAAVTAGWQVTRNLGAFKSALISFSGLEHRLELVRELDGVSYYDDSFGTTPETAIVALNSFEQPKVAILGGSDKGADFSELARVVKDSNVRQVILVGNTANPDYTSAGPKLEKALHDQGYDTITSLVKSGKTSMEEIVRAARAAAKEGDVVLLSAACASFDIFDNYKQRGELFKQAVQALA